MAARLVFLGRLEELAGCDGAGLVMDAPIGWAALMDRLSGDYAPELAEIVGGPRVKVALNGALVADKQALILADGDEIAFLPPVSGG